MLIVALIRIMLAIQLVLLLELLPSLRGLGWKNFQQGGV